MVDTIKIGAQVNLDAKEAEAALKKLNAQGRAFNKELKASKAALNAVISAEKGPTGSGGDREAFRSARAGAGTGDATDLGSSVGTLAGATSWTVSTTRISGLGGSGKNSGRKLTTENISAAAIPSKTKNFFLGLSVATTLFSLGCSTGSEGLLGITGAGTGGMYQVKVRSPYSADIDYFFDNMLLALL